MIQPLILHRKRLKTTEEALSAISEGIAAAEAEIVRLKAEEKVAEREVCEADLAYRKLSRDPLKTSELDKARRKYSFAVHHQGDLQEARRRAERRILQLKALQVPTSKEFESQKQRDEWLTKIDRAILEETLNPPIQNDRIS